MLFCSKTVARENQAIEQLLVTADFIMLIAPDMSRELLVLIGIEIF